MQPQPQSRAYVAAAILLGLALGGAVAGFFIWQWYMLQAINPTIADALRIALFAVPLVLLASGGAVGVLALYRRYATHEYIKAAHITKLTQAQAQRFPSGLQSLSFHDSSKPIAQPPAVVEPLALPPPEPTVPTFAQLLDSGRIGPGRPLLLGFHDGQPIEGSWRDLYSCGIGALQGAGKSWLAAFILAQSAIQGGRLIVCDLHAGNSESLATRIEALGAAYMCDVASTPEAILSALQLAVGKLGQRKAGRGGTWPIIVAIDEWTSLLRTKVGAILPAYLEDISEQGRKFNVNALLSAQGWTKDTAGVVRNRLTSHYVLRQRPDEARYQLGLPASGCPLDVRLLPDATGYLLDVRGNLTKVTIPQMTAADLTRVGTMIQQEARAVGQPFGFTHRTQITATAGLPTGYQQATVQATTTPTPTPATTASERAGSQSAEAHRAADLFLSGSDLPAIVKELRGVTSSEGRRYQTALAEVTDLVRQAMKGA